MRGVRRERGEGGVLGGVSRGRGEEGMLERECVCVCVLEDIHVRSAA